MSDDQEWRASALPQGIADRYQPERPLTAGPLGLLAAAQDRTLGRRVAVRVIPARRVTDQATQERLLAAAQAAGRVPHPGLAAVLDLGATPQGGAFVVSELGDSQPLRDVVGAIGPAPPQVAARVGGELCAALAAVHAAGLTHGAVGVDSILLAADGSVKLLDCGLAGVLGLGRPPGSDAGRRADLAAVGRCVYELITGRPPDQRPPDQLVAELPDGLRAPVRELLLRRGSDAAALAAALRHAAAGDTPTVAAAEAAPAVGDASDTPVGDASEELVQALTRRPRPRRWLGAAAAALVVLLAAALLAAGPLRARQPTSTSATPTAGQTPTTTAGSPLPPAAGGVTAALRVPRVVGLDQAAATRRLADAGLRVGTVYRQRVPGKPGGVVLATGPAAGRVLAAGAPVTLVVAAVPAPEAVAGLIRTIDRDPAAVGRRGRTFGGRLADLAGFHGDRLGAELADLLGIASAGATNGDFTPTFSRQAVAVLAPLVQVGDLAAMAAQFPDTVGPGAVRFAAAAAQLGRSDAADAARLTRDARRRAATGALSAKFAAAAIEALRRVR
jgi:hypothetical protein